MPKKDPDNDFWEEIRPHTGAVESFEHMKGYTANVTLIMKCEAGPFFVKGYQLPSRDKVCYDRELAINGYVRSVSPGLAWLHESDNWAVLAFQVAPGKPADFKPGSRDLPGVIDALNRIAAIECPLVAHEWTEWRWDRFTDRPELFAGNALLHSDTNPSNFLMQDDAATVVDWGYPTRGAAFIDPAQLVVQLIAAGRTPEDAEGWVQGCKAWQSADPSAIDAFAAADVRLQQWAAESRPDDEWHKEMIRAATEWAEYRRSPGGN